MSQQSHTRLLSLIFGDLTQPPPVNPFTALAEKNMSQRKFQFGDRVRHVRRPEWGIGSIVKIEPMALNSQPAQRLSVRFSNAGLKTLVEANAELELVTADASNVVMDQAHPVNEWENLSEEDWLEPLARRKVEEAMTRLPPEIRDPFNSLRERLVLCLDLYRFENTGRSLIDWAVAQTGLDDPLSRFTRPELEQLFEPWSSQRQQHLGRLLNQAKSELGLVRELVASATPAAQQAVRRITVER